MGKDSPPNGERFSGAMGKDSPVMGKDSPVTTIQKISINISPVERKIWILNGGKFIQQQKNALETKKSKAKRPASILQVKPLQASYALWFLFWLRHIYILPVVNYCVSN